MSSWISKHVKPLGLGIFFCLFAAGIALYTLIPSSSRTWGHDEVKNMIKPVLSAIESPLRDIKGTTSNDVTTSKCPSGIMNIGINLAVLIVCVLPVFLGYFVLRLVDSVIIPRVRPSSPRLHNLAFSYAVGFVSKYWAALLGFAAAACGGLYCYYSH